MQRFFGTRLYVESKKPFAPLSFLGLLPRKLPSMHSHPHAVAAPSHHCKTLLRYSRQPVLHCEVSRFRCNENKQQAHVPRAVQNPFNPIICRIFYYPHMSHNIINICRLFFSPSRLSNFRNYKTLGFIIRIKSNPNQRNFLHKELKLPQQHATSALRVPSYSHHPKVGYLRSPACRPLHQHLHSPQ